MGFAAKKGKSVELTLTTEMVQDGMLFITNLLLKKTVYQLLRFRSYHENV